MVATHNEASITNAAGALLNGAATVPPRQALGTVTASLPSCHLGRWPLAWLGMADRPMRPGCNPMHQTLQPFAT